MYLYYRQQTGSKLIIYNTILARHSSMFYIEDAILYGINKNAKL